MCHDITSNVLWDRFIVLKLNELFERIQVQATFPPVVLYFYVESGHKKVFVKVFQ